MITNDILCIVVLYETQINCSCTLRTVNEAMSGLGKLDVVVYDHSLRANNIFNDFKNLNLIYKHDPRNLSIGVAYNYTAELAVKLKKKWILLLDQDTSFNPDLILKYQLSIEQYPNESLFAPILKLKDGSLFSPCHYIFKRGFVLKKINSGLQSLNFKSPVNSGLMIRTINYLNCGGYNESVCLDFSDFQFIERFRRHHNTFVVIDSIGVQDFSNKTTNISKISKRYVLYCQSAKNCERRKYIENVQYFLIVLSRAITLTIRTRKLSFIEIFIKNYMV